MASSIPSWQGCGEVPVAVADGFGRDSLAGMEFSTPENPMKYSNIFHAIPIYDLTVTFYAMTNERNYLRNLRILESTVFYYHSRNLISE